MEKEINQMWTDIYYYLRYNHKEVLTHQAVRVMQVIEKEKTVGIKNVAKAIEVSHNTASEHVKRLIERGYVHKVQHHLDERKVILQLTNEGVQVLHRHSSLDEEKLKQALDNLTKQDREKVLEAFSVLKENAFHVSNR